jgi:hypothetical protein
VPAPYVFPRRAVRGSRPLAFGGGPPPPPTWPFRAWRFRQPQAPPAPPTWPFRACRFRQPQAPPAPPTWPFRAWRFRQPQAPPAPPTWPFRAWRFGRSTPTSQVFDFDLVSYLGPKLGRFAIYPDHVPEQIDPTVEVLPCFTYSLVFADDVNNLSGPSGLVEAHYQIDAWSYQADDVVTMSKMLRDSLRGFRGMMGATKVQGCLLHNRISLDDPPATGADKWVFHRVNEFTFFYIETVTVLS